MKLIKDMGTKLSDKILHDYLIPPTRAHIGWYRAYKVFEQDFNRKIKTSVMRVIGFHMWLDDYMTQIIAKRRNENRS